MKRISEGLGHVSPAGSEQLYDKMKRLMKAESVKTPADKKAEVLYNEDSNLFVGRSLQENEHMTAYTNKPEQITALSVFWSVWTTADIR